MCGGSPPFGENAVASGKQLLELGLPCRAVGALSSCGDDASDGERDSDCDA